MRKQKFLCRIKTRFTEHHSSRSSLLADPLVAPPVDGGVGRREAGSGDVERAESREEERATADALSGFHAASMLFYSDGSHGTCFLSLNLHVLILQSQPHLTSAGHTETPSMQENEEFRG